MDRVSLNLLAIFPYIYFPLFIIQFVISIVSLRDFLILKVWSYGVYVHWFLKVCGWFYVIFGNTTTWPLYVQFYDNTYMMSFYDDIKWFLCWWDIMRALWWLCNTIGSFGRPVLEVVYEETIIHSTEAVWKILARKKWLGYRHDTSSMVDIPRSTPVWAQCIVFSVFNN